MERASAEGDVPVKALLARFSRESGGQLLGPALLSLTIKVASAALSYAMLVAFARMLSAEDYGTFGLMMNAAIVVSALAMVGLPVAVMRFWPAHLEQSDPGKAKGFVVGSLKLIGVTSVIVIFCGVFLSFTGLWDDTAGNAFGPALVAGLAVLITINEFISSLLRAQGSVGWALIPRDIIWRVAAPLAAYVWLLTTGTLSGGGAILASALVLGLLAFAQAIIAYRSTRSITGDVTAVMDWPTWRGPLLPIAGASLLFAMVQQLDVVVVGSLLGTLEAGSYFAAQKTASLLGLVMIAGGMVAAPLMAAAFQGRRFAELQRLCRGLALAISVTTLLGLGLMSLIGGELLALFDADYRSAYGLLMLLSLGYAIDALAGPTAYLMQMTKLEGSYFKVMAATYVLVLTLQLVFVPRYGAIAAAAATTLGYLIWNIAAIRLLRKHIGVDSSLLSFLMPVKPQS